jgi:hypothetical protein
MNHRPCACTVIINIISALSMTVFLYSSAVASGIDFSTDPQADIDSLNVVLDQAFRDTPRSHQKAAVSLFDRVYEDGFIPVDVQMHDTDLHDGFSSDRQMPHSGSITSLKGTVLDGVVVQTAGDEVDLHSKRFSMIPAMAVQVDAPELETLFEDSKGIDIFEDVPVSPVVQDGSFSGGGNDASIIAVQVLTLFNNETKHGGDLDLYVGVNSLFDADYEQSYRLPLAGQTFYGGVNWTF